MKLFKLTEQDYTTYNKFMKWEVGKTNKVKKCNQPELCTSTVIHAYKNKNLALLINPYHANIDNPILLECEGDIIVEDWGKCGTFQLTPIKKLQYPKWYKNNELRQNVQIQFAILCAESVLHLYKEKYPTDDRPRKAIDAAKMYLKEKTKNAYVANAAANAAYAAASAAANAATSAAANAAANAAYAAASAATYAAANAAANAAASAANAAGSTLDFCKLADQAVKIIMENKK